MSAGHGGTRENAGRKGKYFDEGYRGEVKPVKIPVHLEEEVILHVKKILKKERLDKKDGRE